MKKFGLLFLTLTVISCKTHRYVIKSESIIQNQINTAIIDFSQKEKFKNKFRVFELTFELKLENGGYRYILISPVTNSYPLMPHDTIGSTSEVLYNDYKVVNSKLYLWVNKEKQTNFETLSEMDRFSVLDSSFIKGNESYSFSTEEYPTHKMYYVFCLNKPDRYTRVKFRKFLKKNSFKLDCE